MTKLMTHQSAIASALLAAAALVPAHAFAWGHTGHILISTIATQNLPPEVPAFVRSAQAVREIGQLGPEADVSKGTGVPTSGTYPNIRTMFTVHDGERDAGHYIDFADDGTVEGFPLTLTASPNAINPSGRRDFDSAIRTAGGFDHTQYDGYLPYNMIDLWQQVRKDFAYIRAFTKAIQTATTPADKSFFQYQLQLRQTLTLRDIGYWSHFVGDGSQPLHVSVHFNGWGNYPNPSNYTTAPIHAPFEGAFVKAFLTPALVQAKIGAYTDCGCTIEQRVLGYLNTTLTEVAPLYEVEKLSPGFTGYNAAQVDFTAARLAAGATELRDEIVDAWRSSDSITVGYPSIKVSDIENGTIILTPDRFAGD